MKVKNVNLEYNVLRYDWNEKKVVNCNVLKRLDLEEIRKRILTKKIKNYEELKEYLKREFMYYFWSKAECEVLIGDLSFREETFEKIDMWRQIEMNLDLIVKYINYEMRIGFKENATNSK